MTQRWINPQCDTVVSFDTVDYAVNGSHLLGTIKTSYDKLVEMFGEPNGGSCDKVHNSWDIEFEVYDTRGEVVDTVYANIYDWKEEHRSTSKRGEYEWHIGGVWTEHRADWMLMDLFKKSPHPEYRFFRKGA